MSAPLLDVLPGLDVARVTEWIRTLGLGEVAPLSFARGGSGQSNLTFLVEDAAGARWVLRRPPLGTLLASAHDVVREHRVLAALAGTDVPVPRPVGLCADPDVSGAPLLLMEFVDGIVVDTRAVATSLTAARRYAIGLSLATVLGRVHATDLPVTGLDGLASQAPFALRQLTRWRRQWDGTGLREVPAVHALADRLARAVPAQHETTLVHGDYHLLNVVTGRDNGAVTAVLDWELCTLGDPLADLGCLLAYWPAEGEQAPPQQISSLPGFPGRLELVATYAAATGRNVADVGFWHALACWKIAIIAEGVRARSLRQPLNAPRDARLDAGLVDAMLERASAVADEAGIVR